MLRRKLRRVLWGTRHDAEYIPLEDDGAGLGASVTLTRKRDNPQADVTASHLFLGLNPMTLAVPTRTLGGRSESVCLSFTRQPFVSNDLWEGFPTDSRSHARVALSVVGELGALTLLEGRHAEHTLIGRLQRPTQRLSRLLADLRGGDPTNLGFDGNAYDQVRVAYSVPRVIRAVTTGDGAKFNVFPVDLGGPAPDDTHVISLRHGSKAGEQLRNSGRAVEAQVAPDFAPLRYGLGHNHVEALRSRDALAAELPVREIDLGGEQWPIPRAAVRWRALALEDTEDHGLHRFYLCRQTAAEEPHYNPARLAHIHIYGAIWRDRSRISTKYLRP